MTTENDFDAAAHATRYLDAWNTRATHRFSDFFTDDAVYREVAMDEEFVGLDEIRGFLLGLAERFPDVAWEPLQVICQSPELLAIHWRATRTIDGDPNVVEGVSIQHLVDGKVCHNTDFRNRG